MTVPIKLRKELVKDTFYKQCIYNRQDAPNHDCLGRITWEHAWMYQGRQINEKWAIVPCCMNHNSGKAMDKDYNRFRALERADLDELCKRLFKKNWNQEYIYLKDKFNGGNKVGD